jgi:sugar/nucleoside kinase (ribokinase family)
MNHCDILFIGHTSLGTVVPFEGPPFVEQGSPVLYSSIAASRVGKRISAATRISEEEDYLLEPMRDAGIHVFVQPGQIVRYRIVFPTANVDERQAFYTEGPGDVITIDDILPFERCLAHLCWIGPHQPQIDLMRALKAHGFPLSVDMQNFVFQVDKETGIVHFRDVPEKKEIVEMADFVKLDTVEAKILTGADTLQDQADILESWGSSETILTSSGGALAQGNGKRVFAKFTNKRTLGRMGRGDTVMGSYLARRLDHSIEESLRFAVALTSIKLESWGPFNGSVDDAIERMNAQNADS